MNMELKNKIWLECLNEVLGCHEDEHGMMPCDYGMPCESCMYNRDLDRLYRARLEEHGIEY